MKNRTLRVIAAAAWITVTTALSAQKGIDTETPFGSGQDSIRCLQNTYVYSGFFERREYDSAMYYWRQVFNECPASSEDIYVRGEVLYRERLRTTGDSAYIDSVIMVMSLRTFYFDNKPSNDLAISLFLSEHGGNNSFYTELRYSLLKEVADSFPGLMDENHAVLLVEAAVNSYSIGVIDTAEVLAAYLKANEIIDNKLKITPDDPSYNDAAGRIGSLYRASGAMTCSSIEAIYSRKVDEDLRNTALLDDVFDLLTEKGCTGTDFYYRMAVKLFAGNRTAENAVRLAELNLARNNIDKAEGYFSQAYSIDTSRLVRSDVLTRIAAMELEQGKKQQARDRGEHAYELNNMNGKAVFIIAEAYAGSNIGDAFANHAVYWVVVDYLNTAKSLDPSLTADADAKIREYSKLFPTREEGFYHGITDEGIVYRVGGWIGEITRVRFRKE